MKRRFESNRIRYISVEEIKANPAQPRTVFEDAPLRELAVSIKQYGILQPLTVRRSESEYELIAGERRLRAARLAGLDEVPCILVGANEEESSFLALIENLQRQDLDFIDEAESISRLIQKYGLTQEEAAKGIGKSQSAVANKLRILKHPPELLEFFRINKLTERHARSLLRIEDLGKRYAVAERIVLEKLNVADTETIIDALLSDSETVDKEKEISQLDKQKNAPTPKRQRIYIIKDVRIFMNTVKHAVDVMRQAGVSAEMGEAEEDDSIMVTIRIANNRAVSKV